MFHSRLTELPLIKTKARQNQEVDLLTAMIDQIPSQAIGFLRRGYLKRTLLWLIGDRVTPWTSELYLSLESDAEGQRDEMLKGWNAIPATSLAPSPLSGCCTDLQLLPVWLRFAFSTSSANCEFTNLQQNRLVFWTTWCFLVLSPEKWNFSTALQLPWFRLWKLLPLAQLN